MKKNNSLIIKVNTEYYPKEAIITTCCQYLKDNYIFLEKLPRSNGYTKVTLTPKEVKRIGKFKRVKEEFKNELINNTLRYNIAQKNKNIREYVIRSALFFSQPKKTQDNFLLQNLEKTQTQNWKEDPLGIAIPWEEKHKKRKQRFKKVED